MEPECIQRLHISSEDSSNVFKGKYLTGDNAQHGVRGGCWELAAQGEKETPSEKYRRIKCEMDELMNEIVASNVNADALKKDKESYESISTAVNSAQKVLGSLRLENVLGTETVSMASDNEIKKLFAQVEDFRKDSVCDKRDKKTINPQLEHTKRIAELEARLHRIETIVGTRQPERLNRLASTLDTNGTLLDSVQQISTKAALLQTSQLDQIETHIAALITKLTAINEKTAVLSGKSGGHDDKVSALYEIAKKVEPIAKLLPDVLRRMKALESLHNHGKPIILLHFICICLHRQIITVILVHLIIANNFGTTINKLESTQSSLNSTLDGNKVLLQNVQEMFALNLESVNQEVAKLESRLKSAESK